jgi:hypothetical protein
MKKALKAAALSATVTLASVGIATSPALTLPAGASVLNFKSACNSERPMYVYFGFNGRGDSDVLNPCDWSHLSLVSSTWIPSRCALFYNGVKSAGARDYGRYYNYPFFAAVAVVKLDCNR